MDETQFSWELLTIGQMAAIMKERARYAPAWTPLAEHLRQNDALRTAAAHFFFCIALVDHDFDSIRAKSIRRKYIPDIVTPEEDWSDPFEEGRGLIWTKLLGDFTARPSINALLGSRTDWLGGQGFTADSPLSDLMDALRELDWRPADEEWPPADYDGLCQELTGWNASCLEICRRLLPDEQPQAIAQRLSRHLCDTDPVFRTLHNLITNGITQIILTGAPGTGKTYTANLLAQCMGDCLPGAQPLVQFHPSYDYTDFVEGLRPVEIGGKPTFVRLDGSFKSFCREVVKANLRNNPGDRTGASDPNRRYFFLIDEINRADLSKVFGELMFCLEADKRGTPVQTQYRTLPTYIISPETGTAEPLRTGDVFAGGFFIPKNVVIIGTMNDIDRSVENMDFALRRRFEWYEVKVDAPLLTNAFQKGRFGPCLQANAASAAQRIMELNRVVSGTGEGHGGQFNLNRHYHISQGQFANLPGGQADTDDLDALMRYVWDFRIKFLLREYLRGEDEAEVKAFISNCAAALLGTVPAGDGQAAV